MNGEEDDPSTGLHRRTLLVGAALFTGLGAWQTIAENVARTVSSAPLSIRGRALAEITECAPVYTFDGVDGSCPPFEECTSNAGVTTCGVATGDGTVDCSSHACTIEFTCGTHHCMAAECQGTMTGDCSGLDRCFTHDGRCLALDVCRTMQGTCVDLEHCMQFDEGCALCSSLCSSQEPCSVETCPAQGARLARGDNPAVLPFDMIFARSIARG